jgi:two-component system phosphate regulon sensor histidine kinase PhoR
MRGLRRRIALTALAATATALFAMLLLVGPALRRTALEGVRATLLAEARLMARVVQDGLVSGEDPAELDLLVDDASRDVRARVTIIAVDGRVLADSALSGPALLGVENHGQRPEVVQAMAEGSGTSIRRSTTVDEDLLYAAVVIRQGGRVLGVARVAASLAGIAAQAGELRRAVVVALLLAFAITAVLSAALSSPLAGPLADLVSAGRRLAAGERGVRIRVDRRDEIGVLAGLLNRTLDQLEARVAESARERARTEAVLAALEDGVLAVDHRGIVVLANAAVRRHLDLADPVGLHYVEAIRQREVGEVIEDVLSTGERRIREVDLLHPGGAVALIAVAFPGAEGAPHGALLAFHDVTERRRLERVRRDFVANASHELRTPLTSVRGFVEALEDGAVHDPERAGRFLGKIRTHADRMAALIDDLLELSRLESRERPPRWTEVSPAEVAQDVVASFTESARRRRIALTFTDRGAPGVVSDGDRVRHILENLVDNAVKYTTEGGAVEVAAKPGADGGAVVEVRDDGPGIAPEHLPRLFERFYRVDKARSRELGGTGLGLAIVKHLAEGMGGAVSVESRVGRGTCFTLSLPARREHPVTRTGA